MHNVKLNKYTISANMQHLHHSPVEVLQATSATVNCNTDSKTGLQLQPCCSPGHTTITLCWYCTCWVQYRGIMLVSSRTPQTLFPLYGGMGASRTHGARRLSIQNLDVCPLPNDQHECKHQKEYCADVSKRICCSQ